MSATTCETCSALGGEVTCKRNGLIMWSRVMCDECFRAWRAELQTEGKDLVLKGQA